MKYQPLNKLYYKNKDLYEQVYQTRLNGQDCTYQIPLKIHGFPAFVVSSLEVLDLVQNIYHRNNKLTRLYNSLPQGVVQAYIKKVLVEEILLSNDIEGVYSTKKELRLILSSPNPKPNLRFSGLVQKYNKILDKSDIPLENSLDIRKLYDEILLPEIDEKLKPDGNIFRKGAASVYTPTDKELHKGVTPEEDLIQCMDKALAWLANAEAPQIIRIAAFHYLFGYMHPFYDGNGRMSRFITSYLLKDTLNYLVSLRLSYTISNRKNEYYQAFKTCNDVKNRGDITPFVITFLSFILEAIESLIQVITEGLQKINHYHKILDDKCAQLNHFEQDLLFVLVKATLFADEPLTIKELQFSLSYSKAWLQQKLNNLAAQSFVIKGKRGRASSYAANLAYLDQL